MASPLNQTYSLADVQQLASRSLSKLKSNFFKILIITILSSIVALGGMILAPQRYQAHLLLAVEEGESSGWQNLLAQFGLDVGGLNPGGIFEGESLVKLFKTRYMVERTLMDSVAMPSGSVNLATAMFRSTKWGTEGAEYADNIFPHNRADFTPLQDSLMMLLAEEVAAEVLDVYKPDKKLSLVHVNVTHDNKYIAQAFTEAIVQNTTDYFLETITSKARKNLQVLQNQRDSSQDYLNAALRRNAGARDAMVNPLFQSGQVDQYETYVDLQIANALFVEIAKNLTLAEIGLRKQTPLIQVIERPIFPLKRSGLVWYEWMGLGALVGFALGAYLALRQP